MESVWSYCTNILLFFKISKCPKHAFAMLHLQAQVNCLLTPRMSYSLIWNRFVNHQGAIDTNHAMDLDIDHDNKSFKNDCHFYRGEITDKSIDRESRSMEKSDAILYNFDKITSVKKPSGRHTRMSIEERGHNASCWAHQTSRCLKKTQGVSTKHFLTWSIIALNI